MKTQTERVLALSKRFNGVCQSDLLLPDVADGGAPITRVAARLWDLEQEGYEFEAIGTRKKCKVFRLSSGPQDNSQSVPSEAQTGSSEPPSLFKSVGKAQFGYADQGELDAA